jgi:ribonuclease-3
MNNVVNKLVSEEDIETILNAHLETPIKVKDIEVYQQSFVHKSFLIREGFVDEEDSCCVFHFEPVSSNERLEFLGDSILNMATAEYLFKLFRYKDEGFLTKLRTKLVRNTQLSYMGTQLGFKNWLLISNHVERINGRENPRLIEDVFESFIAAVYKDQGFYVVKEFIFSCFDKYVDIKFLVDNNDNFKDILLRYFQMNAWSHPVYSTIATDGVPGSKSFTTVVLVKMDVCASHPNIKTIVNLDEAMQGLYNVYFDDQYMLGVGIGKTKKESEQNASKTTLEMLGVSNDF